MTGRACKWTAHRRFVRWEPASPAAGGRKRAMPSVQTARAALPFCNAATYTACPLWSSPEPGVVAGKFRKRKRGSAPSYALLPHSGRRPSRCGGGARPSSCHRRITTACNDPGSHWPSSWRARRSWESNWISNATDRSPATGVCELLGGHRRPFPRGRIDRRHGRALRASGGHAQRDPPRHGRSRKRERLAQVGISGPCRKSQRIAPASG